MSTYSVYNINIDNDLSIQSGVTAGNILATDGSGGTYWALKPSSSNIYFETVSRDGTVTTNQNWFSNSIPFDGSSTYSFSGMISINGQGTVSHNVQAAFSLNSGTITRFNWVTVGAKGVDSTTSTMTHRDNFARFITTTADTLNSAVIRLNGIMITGSAGSIDPQFRFGTAPGSTSFTASSYFIMKKLM
jgi:hypothetical protein